MLGLGTSALLFWLLDNNEPGAPSPAVTVNAPNIPVSASEQTPYEEPASRELLQIDAAIYNALAKAGIDHNKSRLWIDLSPQGETSRLEVELAPNQAFEPVAAQLNQSLAATKANTAWQKQNNFWHLEAFLDGQLTHQVNLRKSVPSTPASARKPRVAIIVDDVGLNPEALNQLLGLNMELTFSVLPYAPSAPQVSSKIKSQGRELWLHLPMEPLGNHNPGQGALLVSMSQNELERLTREALERVPGAVGVNNHMGSRLTQNVQAVSVPLRVIKEKQLMFIDSVTSPKSMAWSIAREMGITTGQRDIFLDHQVKESIIIQQIEKLIRLAESKGYAIAICHPHAATIAALKQKRSTLLQKVDLVPASRILNTH